MPTDPQLASGTNAIVKIAPITGGATPVVGTYVSTVNTDWTLNRAMKTKDVSNARDGRKRINTLVDYTGNVNGWIDLAQMPNTVVKEGGPYALQLYINATEFYQLSVLISGLDIKSNGVEDAASITFNFEIESGTITEPV